MGLFRALFLLWDGDSRSRPWEGQLLGPDEGRPRLGFWKEQKEVPRMQWAGGVTSRSWTGGAPTSSLSVTPQHQPPSPSSAQASPGLAFAGVYISPVPHHFGPFLSITLSYSVPCGQPEAGKSCPDG